MLVSDADTHSISESPEQKHLHSSGQLHKVPDQTWSTVLISLSLHVVLTIKQRCAFVEEIRKGRKKVHLHTSNSVHIVLWTTHLSNILKEENIAYSNHNQCDKKCLFFTKSRCIVQDPQSLFYFFTPSIRFLLGSTNSHLVMNIWPRRSLCLASGAS